MARSSFSFRWVLRLASVVPCVALLQAPVVVRGQGGEFRGFWVDAFHAGFKSSAEVTTLVNNLRNANCNAVVVEVRKRGDAYYTPDRSYLDYEPHAADTSPANFDSLADLITKAHDTSGGKRRLEVHAWLVTWPVWGSATASSDPQHPYNRHPDWLTRDNAGATWNGQSYCFDPGHPGAFNHTYRIAIHLVTNYDLDGINFDYIRYAGNSWGLNPTAVSRFHARYGGSVNSSNTDTNWLQFRRDQITAFVRKIYLNTVANKPQVKVSANTITWAPGPANLAEWYTSSAAWNNVLQDWRGWMQEGILDLNIPMVYFNQAGPYASDWTNWCNFIRDHQYSRQGLIGPGTYLNGTAEALAQLRYTRAVSPIGNWTRGLCCYSYAMSDQTGRSLETFLNFLTNSPNRFDALSPAVFAEPACIPTMPWKTAPENGHLMGTVLTSDGTNVLDGATVALDGPMSRIQTSDGTGFYGFVDLPPGSYTVRASMPPLSSESKSVNITAGIVASMDLRVVSMDRDSAEKGTVQETDIDPADRPPPDK